MNKLTFNEFSLIVNRNFDNDSLYNVFLTYPNKSSKVFSLRCENMGWMESGGYYWYLNDNSSKIFETQQCDVSRDMMFDLFKYLTGPLQSYQI